KATWPSTRLPSGTIVLPLAVTGCWTTPVNLSPVLLVLEVSVVVRRTWSVVPAGKVTPLSAASPKAGASAATRRLATSAFIAVLISPSPSVFPAGPRRPTLRHRGDTPAAITSTVHAGTLLYKLYSEGSIRAA